MTYNLGERTPPIGGGDSGGRLRWRKDQLQYKPSFEQPEVYVSHLTTISIHFNASS